MQRQVYESSTDMRIFREQNSLSIASIPVNAIQPGIYHAYADFTDTTISPSGPVTSYFIHFDPVGSTLVQLDGYVTFDKPIIGVIARSLTLQNTDGTLGATGTAYPTNRFNRELEYEDRGTYDYFQLMPDDHTIYVHAECSTDVDQIRIVTEAPEPAAGMWTMGTILLGGILGRRRNRQRLRHRRRKSARE